MPRFFVKSVIILYLKAISLSMQKITPTRWFYLFLIAHIICWTLAPSLLRHTLPIDSNEATIWASHLQWGYDRDPYFFAVCAKFALWVSHHAMWGMYLASQCVVGIALWAIWKLANEMLPPFHALIAVMMLELVQYYNIAAIDFDDNVLQMAMWALTLLCFYRALKDKILWYWILTGICTGLMLMTRYYAGIFVCSMFVFLLTNAERRKLFFQANLYCAILCVILLILPHVIWLIQHDWLTVRYVFGRMDEQSLWQSHVLQPLHFIWAQILVCIPAVILYCILNFKVRSRNILEDKKFSLTAFDQSFLLYLGVLPFVITVLLSVLTGFTLRVLWGMPLFSLLSIMLVGVWRMMVTRENFLLFVSLLFGLMALMLAGYAISLIKFGARSSANFPAEKMAQSLTTIWHQHYHERLPYVVGVRDLVGKVAFFSADHPVAYVESNPQISTWVNEQDLQKTGALFIWDMKDGMPLDWKQRFSKLVILMPQDLHSLQDSNTEVMRIGVALLPPQNER